MTSKVEKTIETAKTQLNSALSTLQSEFEKLAEAAALVSGGKAMLVEMCILQGAVGQGRVMAAETNRWASPSYQEHVKAARAALVAEKQRISELHNKNIAAIENNKKCVAQLTNLLQAAGVPSTYQVYDLPSSRSRKKEWITRTAGYVSDFQRIFITEDRFSLCEKAFVEYERKINEYEAKEKASEALAAAESAKKAASHQSVKDLAKLAAKYETDINADELEQKLLSLDKYLRLGHYLYQNRLDWNDGYSSAEQGLSQFSVESDEDQHIKTEISDLIENWDGDGRVFRDCTYNYDYLFSKANDELLNAYRALEQLRFSLPSEYK